MGGLGSYMVAAKFAEKITAAIPICGGGKKVFARLVANKVPCWFFMQPMIHASLYPKQIV